MDRQRETEIQLLCKQILEGVELQYIDEWSGHQFFECPLCHESARDGGQQDPIMKTFGHKKDCPYLIAQGLATF